ncbi:MAG TPA: cell division protein FtsH, partial [Solirubrobacterales bacterium]
MDPAPDGRGAPPQQKQPFIPRNRTFIWVLVGLLAVNVLLAILTSGPSSRPQVPYQPFFVEQVTANNVREISSTADSIDGTLKKEATYTPPDGGDPVKVGSDFKTEVPTFIDNRATTELLTQHHVVINASAPDSGRSVLGTILLSFLPTLLIIGFFLWLIRKQTGGKGGGILGGFGRSTARRVGEDAQNRVTFKDVAGIDEAEEELEEIVDFLKNPQRYTRLGA